ncbi:MAG TPA: choice-of-anchor J domain-containing protein, partial [Candidatus Kapabacteria bacterium]|nr:choice-of-anchor J domain-containing protein [Candidatus Kapabacteria bacterium]
MLYEGFDDGTLPNGWSQEYVSGTVDWTFPVAGVGTPSTVHSGTNKARFYPASYEGYTTKLITTAINFGEYTNNPTLNFWHTQADWGGDQDELRIYYRLSDVGPWILLEEYINDIPDWTEETIILPEVSNTFYLAFEGFSGYGYGIQLDDIIVYASIPPSYCATLSDCSVNWITNVAFGTINNPSLCDGGYSD